MYPNMNVENISTSNKLTFWKNNNLQWATEKRILQNTPQLFTIYLLPVLPNFANFLCPN